ncbi:MAG: phosphoenolpyruvate--protein phosphotransferase [Herbinix sp.]|jgi:phosphotransferase system enzyme I (PtsI)|nr:phosphoenolpyruvate--protein phosphotransferase [Herbinix sp.]
MEIFTGIGGSGGFSYGKLCLLRRKTELVNNPRKIEPDMEILRFEEAKARTDHHLKQLYDKAIQEVGEAGAKIFEVHRMMLQDAQFSEAVKELIRFEGLSSEAAVDQTSQKLCGIFTVMDNEYMKDRVLDILDITKKLLLFLQGEEQSLMKVSQPCILLAEDLVPSETISLERDMILGFITQKGSVCSHTAIIARTLGLPAIVGAAIDLLPEYEGKEVFLDGFDGKIYLEPDESTFAYLMDLRQKDKERMELLRQFRGMESITLDGRKISIYANMGSPEDMMQVIAHDAEGIGLFRSEFLYLKDRYPTEQEQFEAYKAVAEGMSGKKVVIRTLDIGEDKQADYFNLPKEDNPALGYRAIRICLDRIELFKTQLRAIYRAAAYGRIAIMFPMIISMEEILRIKEIIKQVKEELTNEGMKYREADLGIMIETPAAVFISDLLAKEVDFFSIGTNDLTQYTLAIDRQNQKLMQRYDAHHPAILRMIKMVAENAHTNGIWVGICGELAADLSLTETFLEMGIDELSVNPGKVLELRKKVREINIELTKSYLK